MELAVTDKHRTYHDIDTYLYGSICHRSGSNLVVQMELRRHIAAHRFVGRSLLRLEWRHVLSVVFLI